MKYYISNIYLSVWEICFIKYETAKCENTKIESKFVKNILAGEQYFKGSINIEGIFELRQKGVEEANLLITSNQITIMPQNIQGLDIPDEEAENIRTVSDAVNFIKKMEESS